MINHALIMAAGKGTRLMPLTASLPKAMISVNGTTLIGHSIRQLKNKIPQISITVGYKGAALAQHAIEQGVSAIFNTDKRGNAWWIFNTAMKYINEPVLVLTCDNIVELDIDFIDQHYVALNSPPCMVVPVNPVPGIEGDFIVSTNNIVQTLNRNLPTNIYCSGIQVINPFSIAQLIEESTDFYDVWGKLISLKKMYNSSVYPNKWHTINTLEQLSLSSDITS